MRKLKTSDLFSFARCIRNIGIKDEVKKISMEANNVKDIAEKGFDLIYDLFEVACEKKAENEIYEFLSAPFEMPVEEIKDLPLEEFFASIKEIADFRTWKGFFNQAVR